jgi:hypothetical protein
MIRDDHVFIADVMVIDMMKKMVASNLISRPKNVAIEFKASVKIRKYKGLHEKYHFIPMAMEVNGTPRHDMDYFIMECAPLFHNRRLRDTYLILVFLHSIFQARC